MPTKSVDLQNQINELDLLIQQGASDAQLNLWEIQRKDLQGQLQAALQQETELQERLQAEEAAVELIKLPYDFDELFSEEGHPVTGANDMIIEVVKDTKRQANIEKNQAIDEQKAEYEQKIAALKADHEEVEAQKNILLSQNEIMEERARQAILERDDAFNKRDAAFRLLQEANETIASQKIKLENVPQAKSSLDISPSDRLAKMVKESLDEKVKRGLARWDDIIPVNEPQPEHVEELVADAEPQPIEEGNKVDAATPGLADSQPTETGQAQTAESEVITLESLDARLKALELKVAA